MAESIGALEMSLGLNVGSATGSLKKVLDGVSKLSEGGDKATSSFEKLRSTIKDVQSKHSDIIDVNTAKSAVGLVTDISNRILGLHKIIQDVNKTGLKIDTSAVRGQMQQYVSEIQKLYKTTPSGTRISKTQISDWLEGFDKVKEKINITNKATSFITKDLTDVNKYDALIAKYREMIDLLARLKQAQSVGLASGFNTTNNSSMSKLVKDINYVQGVITNTNKYLAGEKMPKNFMGKDFAANIKSANSDVKEVNKAIQDIATSEAKAILEADNLAAAQNKVKGIIFDIEQRIKEVDAAMNMNGVSQNTLNSLASWKSQLESIRNDYQTILSDSSMIKSKDILSSTALNKKMAFAGSKSAISDATGDTKALDKRGEQIIKLKGYVKSLNDELERSNTKTYAPGTDTSKLDAAKLKIQDLILEYQKYIYLLEQGGQLYDKNMLRSMRKDALGDLRTGQTIANASQREVLKQTARANREATQAQKQNEQSLKTLISEYERLTKAAHGTSGALGGLKDLFYQFAPAYGLQQMVMSIIEVGGEIEKQHIAMQSILGDLHNANEMFSQIKGLALESPFKFGELNRDVKQLAAYDVEYKDLYDTTKRLADISAGLGVSFERIALAYGQVKSRSWLDGKELRQFSYAGIPLLKSLADMYSQTQGKQVTTGDVKKMVSKRQVSFEDVQSVLWDMTDEGGKFFNMQSVLADTLYGRYNKLIDAWEIMLSGFAKGDNIVGGTLKHIIDLITDVVLHINTIAPALMAAFAPKALTSLFSASSNGGLVGRLSQAKMAQYNDLQKQIAFNPNFKPTDNYQQDILNSGGKVVEDDVKRLAVAGQINKQELRQLYLKGMITKQTYQQLAAEGKVLGAITATTGKMGVGLVAGLKGVVNFFGGPWMTAFTLAAGAVTYLWQKNEEVNESVKTMGDELMDRYSKISDFLSSHKIYATIDSGNTEEIRKSIEAYYDELKEINPDKAETIMSKAMNIGDLSDQLKFLREQIELMKEGNNIADRYKESFADTKPYFEDAAKGMKAYSDQLQVIRDGFSRFRDSDYERVIQKLRESGNLASANNLRDILSNQGTDAANDALMQFGLQNMGKFDMSQFGLAGFNDLNEANQEVDKYVKSLAEIIKEKIPNVGKDAGVNEGYRQLRESLESQIENLTPENKNIINIKLDELFNIQGDDEARRIFADRIYTMMMGSEDEAIKGLAYKIKYEGYKSLSKAERNVVQKLMQDASKTLSIEYPHLAETLQNLLDDSDFKAHIELEVSENNKSNELQKAIVSKVPYYRSDIRGLVDTWLQNGNLTDARSAAKKLVEERKGEWERLKNQNGKIVKGKKIDLTTEVQKAKHDYDIAVEAQQYVGIDPEKNKNGRKNNRDAELEKWRRWLKLLKEYRAEYDKLRALMGDQEAKNALKNRHEFDELSDPLAMAVDQLDPSDERSNIKRFQEQMKQRLEMTTEPRRSFGVDVTKEKYDVDYKWELKEAEAQTKLQEKYYDEFAKQYDNYKKFRDEYGDLTASMLVYGSKTPQMKIAGKNGQVGKKIFSSLEMQSKSGIIRDELQQKIAEAVKKNPKYAGTTISQLYDKNDEQMLDMFGQESVNRVYDLLNKLKDEEQNIEEIALNKAKEILDYYADTATKITKISQNLKTALDEIDDSKNMSPEMKIDMKNQATAKAGYDMLEFSQENYTLNKEQLTASVEQMQRAADIMKGSLKEAFDKGIISAEEYSEKIKKINNTMDDAKSKDNYFETVLKGGVDSLLKRFKNEANEQFDKGVRTQDLSKGMMNFFEKKDWENAQKNFFGMFDEGGTLYGTEQSNNIFNNLKSSGALDGVMNKFGDIQNMQQLVQGIKSGNFDFGSIFGNGSQQAIQGMQGMSQSATQVGESMQGAGEAMSSAAGDAAGAVGMVDQIVHGINNAVQGLKQAWDKIKEMEESFGNDDMEYSDTDTFLSSFSEASQNATDAWDSLKNGDPMGVISGVIGSFTSWITGFNRGHDKKLQHQIDIAELSQKTLENISNQLSKAVERNMGGLYTAKDSTKIQNQISKLNDKYLKSYAGYGSADNLLKHYDEFSDQRLSNGVTDSIKGSLVGSLLGPLGAITGGIIGGISGLFGKKYSDEAYDFADQFKEVYAYSKDISDELRSALNDMSESGSAYDAEYASLIAQREEVQKMYDAEDHKKDSDESALIDYQSQIDDLTDQIDYFAEDMAESLYGIDFKSWASDFANSIVDAWASGANAAKAYKDSVSDVLKSVATSVIQQKVIEAQLTPLMEEFMDQFEASEGIVDETGTNILSKMFDVAESATQESSDILNAMEQQAQSRGYTLKDKSTGLSSEVANVTEDTADLLGSYINSIRAYVATQNIYFQKLSEDQIPMMSGILQSQLATLNQIQVNTANTYNVLEDFRTMIYNTTMGINPIGVKFISA